MRMMFLDSESILQAGGLIAVALMVFAESGLLFGIVFPGDTLLLTAGFFAGTGRISLFWLIILTIIAAILGDNVGYHFGRRVGPRIFNRKDGLFFRQEYLERTRAFYEQYGGLTVILARFIAFVRTFAPVIAGVGRMEWSTFAFYNVIGAALWGAGLPLIGYAVGSNFPSVDKYFVWALFISAQVLLALVLWEILKNPDTRHKLRAYLGEEWRHFIKKNKS